MGEYRFQQNQYYDLQSLAKTLKLASIDVIQTSDTDIESHWFRTVGPADLYFWKAKNKIVKHQISLFNQVVEWNEYDGVKTGYVNDDFETGEAETICFDQHVNSTVVTQAIEFLRSVNSIEADVIEELISHYRFYNRWQSLPFVKSAQKFFRRFFPKK